MWQIGTSSRQAGKHSHYPDTTGSAAYSFVKTNLAKIHAVQKDEHASYLFIFNEHIFDLAIENEIYHDIIQTNKQ